jgi:hypothetical protein
MSNVSITNVAMSASGIRQEWKVTIFRDDYYYTIVPCELPYDVKVALMDWLKGNGQDHMS